MSDYEPKLLNKIIETMNAMQIYTPENVQSLTLAAYKAGMADGLDIHGRVVVVMAEQIEEATKKQ